MAALRHGDRRQNAGGSSLAAPVFSHQLYDSNFGCHCLLAKRGRKFIMPP
jgi:hypothetical protein